MSQSYVCDYCGEVKQGSSFENKGVKPHYVYDKNYGCLTICDDCFNSEATDLELVE